jgi:hypothetical protein
LPFCLPPTLNCSRLYPDRLQKLLETETKRLADAIIAQHAPIKAAATTFERNSLVSAQLVQKIQDTIDANTRLVSEERKAAARRNGRSG